MGDAVDDRRTESLPDALDIPKVEDLPAPHFHADVNGKRFIDWKDGHNTALLPLMQRMRARYGSERKMLEVVAAHWGLTIVGGLQNAYYNWKRDGNPSGKWRKAPDTNGGRRPYVRKVPTVASATVASATAESSDTVVAPYGSDGSVLIVATVDGVRRTYIGYPADVTVRGGPRP